MYSQNVFCYFFNDLCVPHRGEFSIFSSVVRGNLGNAANLGETFTQSCAAKYEGDGGLYFTALNLTKNNESYERFSLPVMSDYWFVKSVNPIRQTT